MYRRFSILLLLIIIVVGALPLLGLPLSSFAQTSDATPTKKTTDLRESIKTKRDAAKTSLDDYKAAREEQKLAKLITYGDKAIDERTAAVTGQKSRFSAKNCPAVALVAVNDAFATINAALIVQKTTLDSATTLEGAKTATREVFQKNRVYMFLVPAARGACVAQKLINIIIDGRLAEVVTKLKTAGIDTATIETKLAEAKASAQSAYNSYLQVLKAPGGDDEGNKAKMAAAKTSFQTVRKTLGDVKSDIANLLGTYRQQSKTSAPRTLDEPVTP